MSEELVLEPVLELCDEDELVSAAGVWDELCCWLVSVAEVSAVALWSAWEAESSACSI